MKVSFRKSEKKILTSIREGDQKAMEEVYFKYRSEFVSWSQTKFRITEEEALDHYQDTLTIFFEKVLNGTITHIESSIKTYLFGVGKNRVRQQFDEQSRIESHSDGVKEHFLFLAENEDAATVYEEFKEKTAALFQAIGEGCKEILRLFYYEKRSMTEIAEIMGHKSEAVSRTTKKRCLDKIKSQIKKPLADG